MNTKERRKKLRTVSSAPVSQKRPVRKERKLKDADVIYTPPKPFKRGRFVLHLVTVVAVVFAIILGMSIFFKVEKVQVSGHMKYSPWEVSEASGIEIGSNLLGVSRAQVSGNIMSNLPYVDRVRVGIILPDTVNIMITELDAVYSVQDTLGYWWLINNSGKIVDEVNGVTAKSYTQVLGVLLEEPAIGQQAVAHETELTTIPLVDPETGEAPTETETEPEETLESITVDITAAQRLQSAISVLQALGTNSISGQIDSVDVTNLKAIELWYDERFQINLGDTTRLDYKIGALRATIDKMEAYESGHLDLSFTNWADKVGYTPFS